VFSEIKIYERITKCLIC